MTYAKEMVLVNVTCVGANPEDAAKYLQYTDVLYRWGKVVGR
jgi:hypothetical protein